MPLFEKKGNGVAESELPMLSDEHMRERRDGESLGSQVGRLAGRLFAETASQWIAVGVMLGLIFGGCCSNVSLAERDFGWPSARQVSGRDVRADG